MMDTAGYITINDEQQWYDDIYDDNYRVLYEIDEASMIIYQPRRESIST